MLKAYKRLLPYVIGVGLLLIVAYSCRYIAPEFIDIGDYRVLLSTILSTVRNIIHLSLLLFWCLSIRRRIVDNQIRHHLLCVGILMVSWVFLRAVKFEFTMTNEDILAGGTLEFVMGDRPNKTWGVGADAVPPSEGSAINLMK